MIGLQALLLLPMLSSSGDFPKVDVRTIFGGALSGAPEKALWGEIGVQLDVGHGFVRYDFGNGVNGHEIYTAEGQILPDLQRYRHSLVAGAEFKYGYFWWDVGVGWRWMRLDDYGFADESRPIYTRDPQGNFAIEDRPAGWVWLEPGRKSGVVVLSEVGLGGQWGGVGFHIEAGRRVAIMGLNLQFRFGGG